MAKRKVITTPIPSIDTKWDDGISAYCGEAVETFIKEQLKSKVGALYFDDSEDAFITVVFFRSEEDKAAWIADRSNESCVMARQTFQVASRNGEGTAYVVTLKAQGASEPKFTNEKKMLIPLQFTCKKATTVAGQTTIEDMAGISGTIVVSGRKAGTSGAFTTLQPSDGQVRYLDAVPLDSATFKNFDLGAYLQDGEWNYRITVVEPEKLTTSSAVAVNVTMSESMGLDYAGDLGHPFSGDTVLLPFYVKGSVDRLLHIQILDAAGKNVLATPEAVAFSSTQGGSETVQNISITKQQYRFTHGTYTIKAWLTFASDTNGNKVAEQSFGIMFKEDGNNQVLVAVSDILKEADNFDTVTLFRYAVYNPAGDEYPLTMQIIDGMNGDLVYHEEENKCANGQSYVFHTALNCEHAIGDFSIQVLIKNENTVYYSGSVYLVNDLDFSARGKANLEMTPNNKTFKGTDNTGHSFVFDPVTLKLVNQPADNKTKILNPTIEGFVRENNIDRFRLLRGSKIDLPFEPFTTFTGLVVGGADHSMTMEFDVKIDNINNEDSPVIQCFTPSAKNFVGLKVLPNRILVLGSGEGPISIPDQADYYLEEGVRSHIAINIVNNLRKENLNYMRIFVDGIMQREYTYASGDESPFCGANGTNGHLILGSDGCDMDIFGMRIMLDQGMSSADIQQDFKASMSSIAEKRAFVDANDKILSGGIIDYDKCKGVYNTICYRLPDNATFPTFNNDPGTIYGVQIDLNIVGDEKHSGVFYHNEIKRQGSTAKKYYWPNIGHKCSKANAEKGIQAGYFISTGINEETGKPYYDHTTYYQLDDSQPKSKKWVGKANYASSMQSHKIGCTAAFNDLHRICALPNGGFTFDQVNKKTPSRRAVKEKPFLCFYTDKNHPTPTFCGFQTWGAAKGDKPTFGMCDDESKAEYTPDFVMLEGSDNDKAGTNFETPWIPSEMRYDVGEEAFCYNGEANFDMDLGTLNEDVDKNDPLYNQPTGGALTSLNDYFIPAFNMVYYFNPNLRAYRGGLNALNQAHIRDKARKADKENTEPLELEANVHYWCSDSTSAEYMNVYRLDYVNDQWVDAGLTTSTLRDNRGFNNIGVSVLNLKQQLDITDQDLFGMNDAQKTEEIVRRRVAKFRQEFPKWFDVSDALFHQCFIKLVAGTDNRAKNTYFWIEGNIDHLIRFDGDDLDTVFKTDNKGQQSKKYWILEDDKDEYGAWFWNGRDNALFRLIEMAYEDDMRTMMNRIFAAMTTLSGSVEKFFQEYFYSTQEYFPAVAYNETARLNYEAAQLYYLGIHPSEPGKSYGYKEMPITQSLGNQIHAEREYMTKRLALLTSYANYGDFALDGADAIMFTSTGNTTYNFTWTAYQDIFPVAAFGQALNYGVDENGVRHTKPWRLKAGHSYTITTQMSGETTVALHGMSYCSEIQGIGGNAIKGALRLTGKRLTKLIMPKTNNDFQPSSIVLSNNMNLEEIDWRNMDFSHSSPAFDFTSMTSLKSLNLSGCTGITGVDVPKTASLTKLMLPSGLSRLEITGMPSLREFAIDSVADLKHAFIDSTGITSIDTIGLASSLRSEAKGLLSLTIKDVNWQNLPVAMLLWMADQKPYTKGENTQPYSLTGRVGVNQTSGRLTYAFKKRLVEAFGNIDATSGVPLIVTYDKVAATGISINGKTYIGSTGQETFTIGVSPTYANNIAIVTEADGSIHEDVRFAFVDADGAESTPLQYCNWEDAIKGLLNVNKVTTEGNGIRYNLRVTVGVLTGNTKKYLTSEMNVGFYTRHPKIGDFAYADGTFDNQYQKDKTVVGIVYKREPMLQGPDDRDPILYQGYNEPTQEDKLTKEVVGYRLLIDCKENATIKSKSGFINTASNAWGLYQEGSGDGVYSTNGFTPNTGAEVAAAAGLGSAFDLPIDNLPSGNGWNNGTYVTLATYFDSETESGYKAFSGMNAPNDWAGKMKTQAIVNHMESIFNNYLMDADKNKRVLTTWNEALPTGETIEHTLNMLPTTMEELGDMMEILQKANGNLGVFRQFAYPAGYSCYLYEPTLKDGEMLDEQYSRHNWYLPAEGELIRQFAYYGKSRTGAFTSDRTQGAGTQPARSKIEALLREAYNSPDSSFIRDNVKMSSIDAGVYKKEEIDAIEQWFSNLQDCDKPIYSMEAWRCAMQGSNPQFTNHTAGYHWSSSEGSLYYSWYVYFSDGFTNNYGYGKNNGYVVRPAVAYSFFL